MTATPDPAPRRRDGFTTRAWFQTIIATMVVVVLLGAAVTAQVIRTTTAATDRLIGQTMPAQRTALEFQSALLDQETGVRGFAITRDRQFLDPYTAGLDTQQRKAQELRKLLGDKDDQLTRDIDGIEQAVEQWRASYVTPLLTGTDAQASGTTGQGKQIFDRIRTLFAAQNQHLSQAVRADTDRLDHARLVRNSVLIALLIAFVATGAVLTVLLRRLVDRPLRYLTQSSLRVAGGDFGFRIDAQGPADIAAVATAVEDMRRRIVSELEAARAQETLLAEQTTALEAQAVELRRSNGELEQFAYVASHDLQEPLRKVASFCQLLEKRYSGQLDERATQYIEYAVDGAKRMQILINDLLIFSRVGRVTDGDRPIALGEPLQRALANLTSAIDDTGARITQPEQLPEIVGEPTLLTMLWQNLIANAIKFRAPDRTPEILITCEPDADGYLFTVQDNGIGIDAEFADKVFVIFQRLHNRTEYEGTGIGLALVKKVVEHHGGRIWVDTDYHDGTRICFTLSSQPTVPAPEGPRS
ncbi:HAMP domain-containing protein [Nocardia yunnanensis]|uniref:histidine kinase n=1 Tax=Nocardia yunnanensis TaxID=2382165 RepID=A0A386ZI60_9NOCA|nr:sensor histidine kinase [Nocardia yunnanensis]AYF76893.1 HAMP domain-containing protein [Nocardia yunnanensis]